MHRQTLEYQITGMIVFNLYFIKKDLVLAALNFTLFTELNLNTDLQI